MIYENIMFNNVDELIPTASGLRLCRYTEDVRLKMNERARRIALFACGSEIRFVTSANAVYIKLKAEMGGYVTRYGKATATIFRGDYFFDSYEIAEGAVTTIFLETPGQLVNMPESFFEGNVFSKDVWRIHLSNGQFEFCGIDTFGEEIRPPRPDEVPGKTILSYGSSISHGLISSDNTQSYVNTFARLMKANVLTKGLSGACHAEKEVADWFASRDDWDIALMEIGINMLGFYEPDEFAGKFSYFADKLYETGKKIIFLTIPIIYSIYNTKIEGRDAEYDEIIREKCKQFDQDRVLLVESRKLEKSTNFLTVDRVHPSTAGHIDMGHNLFNEVKDWIK